ncbi:MAG TPA: response regulator [Nitrospirae bacterium]|nr:alkaline phosphatase synthesis transcriptional regulatory protein PhoP [bacterium BMS3Bbin08]HDK16340.1 response regulator [Nitrospirota bacterium]HDO25480.1 response regulator [Nitrospirota bacterium]HDZ84176.1 response regulator [Nitrospirota bacterium]
MKILIVDDDIHIQRLYKEELEEEGYEVVIAGTGNKAFELFEKEDPDIVTLDILMPDIDGKILLKKMKEQRPQTPVIISSAYDYHDDFAVWASESDAYIVKSSDLSELTNKIKKIIRGGKKRKGYE